MMMRKTLLSGLIAALLTNQASAFWEEGHLLVARVAYDHLQKEAPHALAAANQLLAVYARAQPSLTHLEKNHPFVECATFADEIKAHGGSYQSNWHFIDTPYLDEGGRVEDFPNFKFEEENIAVVIPAIINWLKGTPGYQNSFVYEAIKNAVPNEEEAKSYALRLLIHYVGDLHQPLHATSRLDSKYPKGDAGGNFFHITEESGIKNLHAVWDSMVFEYTGHVALPYSDADWNKIGSVSGAFQSKFNVDSYEYENNDVNRWAKESLILSEQNVYSGVKENQAVSDEYKHKNQLVIEKQIVIGGLRLAHVIKSIYGTSSAAVEEFETEEAAVKVSTFLQ